MYKHNPILSTLITLYCNGRRKKVFSIIKYCGWGEREGGSEAFDIIYDSWILPSTIHPKFQPSNSINEDFGISSCRFEFKIFNFFLRLKIPEIYFFVLLKSFEIPNRRWYIKNDPFSWKQLDKLIKD